jgi:hypothetical protein
MLRLMRLFYTLISMRSESHVSAMRTLTRLFAAGAGILRACGASYSSAKGCSEVWSAFQGTYMSFEMYATGFASVLWDC